MVRAAHRPRAGVRPGAYSSEVAQVVEMQAAMPIDATACGQADILLKLPRRSGPPLTPVKTSAPGSGFTYTGR